MTFFRYFNPYLNVLYGRLQYLISQSDRCYFKAFLIALEEPIILHKRKDFSGSPLPNTQA